MSDLAAALMVAIHVHAGQRDKRGEPYLFHVLRVFEAVGEGSKSVAVLHDAMENAEKAGICFADLSGYCHLSFAEQDALKGLTRGEGEMYGNYIERVRSTNTLAREVKRADLRDNLARIPPCRPGFLMYGVGSERWASLKARYEKAIAILEAAT